MSDTYGRRRPSSRVAGYGPRLESLQPRPRHRRRSRRVYIRRRVAVAVLAVLIVLVMLVVVVEIVRALSPSHPAARTALGTRGGTAASPRSGGAPPPVGVTAPVGTTTVVLAAVGDVQLGTTGELPPNPAQYLDLVKARLASPVVFGNLEGTLSTATASKCSAGSTDCFAFEDPPAYAGYLYADGFDVLNSANNHAHDFGTAGAVQTSAALTSAGIVQSGLPGQIGVIDDGGTKVAFVDFAPYDTANNLLDFPAAKALIKKAKTLAAVVIVYMYAGAEGSAADHVTGSEETYLGEDRGNPQAFAEAAVDDGAAAVIASGPHVLRGIQFYRGHLIDYSLGDFAGYRNFATVSPLNLSGILHLQLSPSGAFVKASWTSVALNADGQPAVDPSKAAATFVNTLSRDDFGSSAAQIGLDGSIRPVTSATPPTSPASPSTSAA